MKRLSYDRRCVRAIDFVPPIQFRFITNLIADLMAAPSASTRPLTAPVAAAVAASAAVTTLLVVVVVAMVVAMVSCSQLSQHRERRKTTCLFERFLPCLCPKHVLNVLLNPSSTLPSRNIFLALVR